MSQLSTRQMGVKKRSGKETIPPLTFIRLTLAALGAEIEGDQLGLGVNLFSGKENAI